MTNFERATLRMQARGCRPFQPDTHHGRSERVLRPTVRNPEPDARAIDRIDRVIGTVGFIGVAVLIGLLLIEWVAA